MTPEPESDLALPKGFSRETDIRRDGEGRWYQGDVAITHPNLVRSFNRWLERRPNGRYCLRNAIHWVYVHIEGAPLFVRSVCLRDESVFLALADETEVRLEANTLRENHEGRLFAWVSSRNMWAQFDSHAAVQLADWIEVEDNETYFRRRQERHIIAPIKSTEEGLALPPR